MMFAQLLRFGGVGLFATAVHVLAALAAQSGLSLTAQQANLGGFIAAVPVSCFGHARIAFGVNPGLAGQVQRLVTVSLIGLATSSLTVGLVTSVLGLDFSIAMAVVALLVPVATYLAMRFWAVTDRTASVAPALGDILLCALLALAVPVIFWDRLTNHDIAWYLFATRDWLAGAELYVDLIEVNPPLYFYLTRPALTVADLLQISDANGHTITVALLFFASLAWASAILRSDFSFSAGRRALLLIAMALAALLPTLNGLGQREQVLVLSFLPWALHEASGRKNVLGPSLPRATFAAAGMCLKPHFVLLPLAVTLLNCLESRSLKPVLSVANMVFLVVGLAYVAGVMILHPAYLSEIVPMAIEIYGAYGLPFGDVFMRIGYTLLPVPILAFVLYKQGALTREIKVFLALALAGLASFLLQSTAFAYHKVPVFAFSAIACTFVLLRANKMGRDVMLAALAVVVLAITGAGQGFYRNSSVPVTKTALAEFGPIDGVMTLSSNVYPGPPLAQVLETDWISSYPTNWLVPGAFNRLAETDCLAQPNICDRLRAIAARNRSDNITDIDRRKPELLIVDLDSGHFDKPRFDWLAFMAEDPAWAGVFAPYRQVAANARYLYFMRKP